MANPYDSPEFAVKYTKDQADPNGPNWYEWQVTNNFLRLALDMQSSPPSSVLDFGCGNGAFTIYNALSQQITSHNSKPPLTIGTDASETMISIANGIDQKELGLSQNPVRFFSWDLGTNPIPPFNDIGFDVIISKLSLNYISPQELDNTVFPALYRLLGDKGIFLAVLPNPLREADYQVDRESISYQQTIKIGNFSDLPETTSFHHPSGQILRSLAETGFKSIAILPIPNVKRFFTRKIPFIGEKKPVYVADQTPLSVNTIHNTSKRVIYVAGKEYSGQKVAEYISRYQQAIFTNFPEIADMRSDYYSPSRSSTPDGRIFGNPTQTAYVYGSDKGGPRFVYVSERNRLTPRERKKLVNALYRIGIRYNTLGLTELNPYTCPCANTAFRGRGVWH